MTEVALALLTAVVTASGWYVALYYYREYRDVKASHRALTQPFAEAAVAAMAHEDVDEEENDEAE